MKWQGATSCLQQEIKESFLNLNLPFLPTRLEMWLLTALGKLTSSWLLRVHIVRADLYLLLPRVSICPLTCPALHRTLPPNPSQERPHKKWVAVPQQHRGRWLLPRLFFTSPTALQDGEENQDHKERPILSLEEKDNILRGILEDNTTIKVEEKHSQIRKKEILNEFRD